MDGDVWPHIKLASEDVVEQGGGIRTGTLPNGDKVVVRPSSSGGRPTLEIQKPKPSKEKIKIRY